MEVDLVAEINDNPTIKEDFQSILQRSYQQANRQIKDAEKQSEVLFMNIAELQKKIQEDETNFTEDKKVRKCFHAISSNY